MWQKYAHPPLCPETVSCCVLAVLCQQYLACRLTGESAYPQGIQNLVDEAYEQNSDSIPTLRLLHSPDSHTHGIANYLESRLVLPSRPQRPVLLTG